MNSASYIEEANEKASCDFAGIEHHEGVKNVESIVRTPGVDAIIIGPYDLSEKLWQAGTNQRWRSAASNYRN